MQRQPDRLESSLMHGRKQPLRILLSFLCCSFCLPCYAQQPSADEILRKVGETYRGLQSYQFIAHEVVEISPSHMSKSDISLSYSAPRKIRLEVRDDDGMSLLVSDGQTRWIYLTNRKQYTTEPGNGDEAVTREGGSWNCRHTVRSWSSVFVNFRKKAHRRSLRRKIDCPLAQMPSAATS